MNAHHTRPASIPKNSGGVQEQKWVVEELVSGRWIACEPDPAIPEADDGSLALMIHPTKGNATQAMNEILHEIWKAIPTQPIAELAELFRVSRLNKETILGTDIELPGHLATDHQTRRSRN